MGAEPRPQVISLLAGDDLQQALCHISETYGRGICREPQRLEAMLRDLCPEKRRESFLLVAALRERVVYDLVTGLDSVPDELLVARSVANLRDNLGLAENSARWTVESWLPACRILANAPDIPLHFDSPESAADSWPASEKQTARSCRVDWAWLGLCLLAMVCSAVALLTIARVTFFHFWNSFGGWLSEVTVLGAGLSVSGFGLALVSRAMGGRRAPNQRMLDPNRAAGAMLIEVLTLLALPLVPAVGVGMWAAEWIGALHVSGQAHDLAFHLGRLLQTLTMGLYLYYWLPLMTVIQGKIASTMVRQR